MKVTKVVCLDLDIIEKLKGLNASKLINTLLKEHLKKDEVKPNEDTATIHN